MADLGQYEGCGKVGPIRSIFFAEFHPIAGPMIRCQAPSRGEGTKDIVTKDVFEAISVYIIPKPQLDRTPLTVNVLERKICGYPVVLKDEKYKRNSFMFNVCFVCHPWSRTVQYEPALVKLSNFLVDIELESEFLSNEQNNQALQEMLEIVFHDLNEKGECSVHALGYTLQLKVTSIAPDPPIVNDWDVPILLANIKNNEASERGTTNDKEEWDLTTQQILNYIDGIWHIKKIALEAGVDTTLVRAAIQNLLYHRVIDIVPIFLYSNSYCLTPKLKDLRDSNKLALRNEFMEFIKRKDNSENVMELIEEDNSMKAPSSETSFREIYKMVCEFNNHTTVQDICVRFKPRETLNIDEVKLVQYLTMKKILRKVNKYPVYVQDANSSLGVTNTDQTGNGVASEYYPMFDGTKHYDEICCQLGMSIKNLEEIIENDPNVYVIRQ